MKILALLFLLSSCMQFLKFTDESFFEKIETKTNSKELNIVFSHNINGETHPCGCRNFPLGGIPQAAGKLYELKNKAPLIYVDTGDTLFPSTVVPESLKKSQSFTANKIIEALELQGLKFFVPGDQDFAMGEQFLVEVSNKAHFSFLIANLRKEKSKIKAHPWKIVKYSNHNIIFIGAIDQQVMGQYSKLFFDPVAAIKKSLDEIKSKEINLKNSRIILLTHGGLEFDKMLAQKFPQVSWIIGSHTQSFLREAHKEGKVQIAQVLSRNHYLGQITLPASLKVKSKYQIIENRDELKDLWPNNPFTPWLNQYKTKLDQIQKTEQESLTANFVQDQSAPTYNSCRDCHSKQVEFWRGTEHSLAFITLHQNNASNNPNCIECHSLNYKKASGFSSKKNIILTKKDHTKYWAEFSKIFANSKSIKKTSVKARKKLSEKWSKLDDKFELNHNFANVQCLNCHTKATDHPFESGTVRVDKDYKSKCLTCHTQDQSPEWYSKNAKGIATDLNMKYFKLQLKKVACPKND